MCYALPAMLRGCRSCAISDRPTPLPSFRLPATAHPLPVSSHFEPSTFNFERFSPLSPLFPLDTSHSPVTPLFPLDTRNRGGTPPSNMTNRSIPESSPTGLLVLSSRFSQSPSRLRPHARLCALRVLCGEAFVCDFRLLSTRHSPLSLIIPVHPGHSPLSLIIPVHPGHSPLSPIIPVHTQKQGGGGAFCICAP
jgi:hypothetical protein